jgi:hypothetical protein
MPPEHPSLSVCDEIFGLRARGDAVAEACISCLEATTIICSLLEVETMPEVSADVDRLQEALGATRAATEAIRFALVERSTNERRNHQGRRTVDVPLSRMVQVPRNQL